jgi:hypothetical protein
MRNASRRQAQYYRSFYRRPAEKTPGQPRLVSESIGEKLSNISNIYQPATGAKF